MPARGLTKRDEEIVRVVTAAIEGKLTDLSDEEVAGLREILEMKDNIAVLFKFGEIGKRFIIGLSGLIATVVAIVNMFPMIKKLLGLPE